MYHRVYPHVPLGTGCYISGTRGFRDGTGEFCDAAKVFGAANITDRCLAARLHIILSRIAADNEAYREDSFQHFDHRG